MQERGKGARTRSMQEKLGKEPRSLISNWEECTRQQKLKKHYTVDGEKYSAKRAELGMNPFKTIIVGRKL